MKQVLGLLVLGLAVALPQPASAESTTCGAATPIIPDGRISQSFISTGSTFYLYAELVTGRSYSIEFKTLNSDFNTGLSSLTLYDGASNCASDTAYTGGRDTSGIAPSVEALGNLRRVSFDAPSTFVFFRVTNTSGTSVTYQFSLSETTMYSPAWSTNGSYNTYYSFFNTTNSTVNVTVTLTQTDGTAAGATSVAVLSGRTAATNTVALVTIRNKTGTARMTHDGPPGAILVEADIANFTLSPPYIQPVKFEAPRETR